ncbi:MAG: DUF3006 family protein [Quinella sp. 1Q7]|nr:DUF3006 family protein [Quinella sp. 1Q7]
MDGTSENSAKEIIVYLDRIEELDEDEAEAVLYIEDDDDDVREFILPADFLPADADEGEYLTITISRAVEKTRAALDEARSLLATVNQE